MCSVSGISTVVVVVYTSTNYMNLNYTGFFFIVRFYISLLSTTAFVGPIVFDEKWEKRISVYYTYIHTYIKYLLKNFLLFHTLKNCVFFIFKNLPIVICIYFNVYCFIMTLYFIFIFILFLDTYYIYINIYYNIYLFFYYLK